MNSESEGRCWCAAGVALPTGVALTVRTRCRGRRRYRDWRSTRADPGSLRVRWARWHELTAGMTTYVTSEQAGTDRGADDAERRVPLSTAWGVPEP